jgi:ribose 5-phosphate isomerase B
LRIALGSDERSSLTDSVEQALRKRGYEIERYGAITEDAEAGVTESWPDVAQAVAERVAAGAVDEGILLCWTGTGVSIAANKVHGVRAALCGDAETARGAKAWNAANVLCLSLRATSDVIAREILEAWFSAESDPGEEPNIEKVRQLEKRYPGGPGFAQGEKGS